MTVPIRRCSKVRATPAGLPRIVWPCRIPHTPVWIIWRSNSRAAGRLSNNFPAIIMIFLYFYFSVPLAPYNEWHWQLTDIDIKRNQCCRTFELNFELLIKSEQEEKSSFCIRAISQSRNTHKTQNKIMRTYSNWFFHQHLFYRRLYLRWYGMYEWKWGVKLSPGYTHSIFSHFKSPTP